MRRQPSSVAARYLLARLRPLTQPIFWGPSIALMFVILFTWQYWMRPEWVSYLGVAPSSDDASGLSPEDRAIGADIDTLPLLFNDIGLSANSAYRQVDPSGSVPAATNLKTLPQIPIAGLTPIASQPSNGSVFSATMQKLGLPDAGLTGTAPIAESNSTQPPSPTPLLGFPNAGAPTENPQPALSDNGVSGGDLAISFTNRAVQTPASFSAIVPATPSYSPTAGSFGATAPTATSYPNSYTGLVEGTQPLPASGTVPIVLLSPLSTQPPAIASPALNNSPSLNPVPVGPALQPPQSFPSDAPFTAPRPIPGRVLGGGQINTFSNP